MEEQDCSEPHAAAERPVETLPDSKAHVQELQHFLEEGSSSLSGSAGREDGCRARSSVSRRVAASVGVAFVISLLAFVLLKPSSGLTAAEMERLTKLHLAVKEANGIGLTSGFAAKDMIRNKYTGLCLSWGDIIVANVVCNPAHSIQIWGYIREAKLLLSRDLRCMDTGGKYLHVWACTDRQPQVWEYDADTFHLKQEMPEGLRCLTGNRTHVSMEPCNPKNHWQRWEFAESLRGRKQNNTMLLHMEHAFAY